MSTYSTISVCLPELAEAWLQAVIVQGWGQVSTALVSSMKIDINDPFGE